MQKKVYIARNYRSKFDAAGKAKMDCETILEQNGWQNIGLKQTWIANSLLGTLISAIGVAWALIRLKPHSLLCLQYPFNKFYGVCLWGARLKRCDIVTLVHDVRSLKGKYGYSAREIRQLKRSTLLVVHNAAMKKWFTEQGLTMPMVGIHAFDYLHDSTLQHAKAPLDSTSLRVVFAGKMNNFIYELDDVEGGNFRIDIYGVGFKPERIKRQDDSLLNYIGCFPADQVIDRIDGDFGLVWYGDSLDSCDGESGQYLKFNNPHKLSLYVLCEMPIIIWDKAAMANFVTEQGIGLALGSLRELKQKLATLSLQDIERMKTNIQAVKSRMQSGQYLTDALNVVDEQSGQL